MSNDRALDALVRDATALLRALIVTPSFSGGEDRAAGIVADAIAARGLEPRREGNNVWAYAAPPAPEKRTLLLNGHLDTVRPNGGYTRDPFSADVEDGRLYGLGSNDAGGALVALLAAFLEFAGRDDTSWNLVFSATAEEETSGRNGIESALQRMDPVDAAVIGEPTGMRMAVSERGLLVLDCTAHGRAGHAARSEGDNALYRALDDIQWFRSFRFPRTSPTLGEVRMTVTAAHAGSVHNMIPDRCDFLVDARTTDAYTNEEVLEVIRAHVSCDVVPRSMRLRATAIADDHPLVAAGRALGLEAYGSPTTSNKALVPFPALKLGPGDSARSHTADEFIYLDDIASGIAGYAALLDRVLNRR